MRYRSPPHLTRQRYHSACPSVRSKLLDFPKAPVPNVPMLVHTSNAPDYRGKNSLENANPYHIAVRQVAAYPLTLHRVYRIVSVDDR